MNDFTEIQAALAYRLADAYRMAGIGRTRFYGLIAEGKIEARRCGGRTLIPADSLRNFLAGLPRASIGKKSAG